jgi:hypothetical protein
MTFSWYARAMTGWITAALGRAALLKTVFVSAERNIFGGCGGGKQRGGG